MKFNIFLLFFLGYLLISAQTTKRVLFLGNSYTNVNNLPQMLADVASSVGDVVTFDSNTPGGYTLQGHSTNASSLSKIAIGNWDYVVLQEQSQLPSFSNTQVANSVFPYAHYLDSLINAQNPCAETAFYMTWGRKNGDASNCTSWPPVCTYAGMDSLLSLRYRMMADSNNAIVSPVGAVWKYIRQNFPAIELYQADESHPSVEGTYAAACCFYAALFKKDPTLISFNSSLNATDAANIRAAAKTIVFDNFMLWNIGAYEPTPNFTYVNTGNLEVTFTNTSSNAINYSWNFGDGNFSTAINPTHTYASSGTYTVELVVSKCGVLTADTLIQNITINPIGINNIINNLSSVSIYPNPANNFITLQASTKLIGSTYSIYDSNGKAVLIGNITETHTRIDVSKLAKGLYVIKLGNATHEQIKIIKE
jgi:hypothetical protein